ncbi:MAG: hypothetical protein Q9O62_04630 [Ardenticatenia bacterium]|nr:hypothetical protein [Ardenticatenia bacterium]
MTVPLSMAVIETPDVLYWTPLTAGKGRCLSPALWPRRRGRCPDAPEGQPAGWWLPEEPVRRAVLFMHPPSRATFTVTLPVTPTALVFGWG